MFVPRALPAGPLGVSCISFCWLTLCRHYRLGFLVTLPTHSRAGLCAILRFPRHTL